MKDKIIFVISIVLNIILIVALFLKSALNDIIKGLWNRREQKRSERMEALRKRYSLIYAPLRALLLEGHITESEIVRYPKLSQRLENSWHYFKRRRRIIDSIKMIFDYGKERRAELEFGAFSVNEIRRVIEKHIDCADSKLLSNTQWAERSRYESFHGDYSDLTNEELELIEYIFVTYKKLNKKLIPS